MEHMYENTTVEMENEVTAETTPISKGLAIFYKIQSVCCFTALLSLLGVLPVVGVELDGILSSLVFICILIGMVSSLIAAPIMIVKFVLKAGLAAGKFGLCIPVVPVNLLLAFAFGVFTAGFLAIAMILCSGIITVYKYFTVLRYV